MPDASGYCTQCGAALAPRAAFCSACGLPIAAATAPLASGELPPPPRPVLGYGNQPAPAYYAPPPEQDSGMTTIFPYKNGKALLAYYLGCFSFIFPPLAIAAVILGILGIGSYNNEPRLKGLAHAWIGIVSGVIACVLWVALIASWQSAFMPSD